MTVSFPTRFGRHLLLGAVTPVVAAGCAQTTREKKSMTDVVDPSDTNATDDTDGVIGAEATDDADSVDATDVTDGVDATEATDSEADSDGTDAVDDTDAVDATDAVDGTENVDGNEDSTDVTDSTDFSSIELLSLKGGRCSPPSSLEYAPIGANSLRRKLRGDRSISILSYPLNSSWAIFNAKCASCHTTGTSGTLQIGAGVIAAAYASSQQGAYSLMGTKAAAALVRIQNGTMPQGKGCTDNPALDEMKPACLTAAEQATIKVWLDGGQAGPTP